METILLLWDASARKLAIKSTTNKKDARAYRIRYNEKGNGATFSAKTFMDHIGLDYSEQRAVSIEIDVNNEYLLEVQLPDNFFRKAQKEPKSLERVMKTG